MKGLLRRQTDKNINKNMLVSFGDQIHLITKCFHTKKVCAASFDPQILKGTNELQLHSIVNTVMECAITDPV